MSQVFVSFLTGALTALILKVLGLDLWLVFGVLAFWLNFVPNVGSAVLQPVERALHPV